MKLGKKKLKKNKQQQQKHTFPDFGTMTAEFFSLYFPGCFMKKSNIGKKNEIKALLWTVNGGSDCSCYEQLHAV